MDMSEVLELMKAGGADLAANVDRAVKRGLSPLKIPATLRLSQHAEAHFYLSAESSYVESKWTCYPFQRAIMDCIGHDDIEVVDLRKSARVGYTKMLLAAVNYFVEHKRRKIVLYQPTDDDRDEFVETEIDPMLRDVKVMRNIFPAFKSRNSGNTKRFKRFLTGVLHLRGGKAAKNYRRLTVDVVMYDELDGFDRDIEKEGSPTKLGDKRLEGATWPKSIRGTTPKTRHQSHIEDSEGSADLHIRFNVPCPHCGEEHPLTWGGKDVAHGIKWTNGDPETACHICPHCGAAMTQGEYLEVWHKGRWIGNDGTWIDTDCNFVNAAGEIIKPPRHIAIHIWTAYSPQAAWSKLVQDFLDASKRAERGDFSELKTFVNTTLGETWEEKGEAGDENALQARAKASGFKLGVVPIGCLVLCAGVDVQDNRFEITVWGFGRGEEMWTIDDQVLDANPADERDWLKLDAYLQSRYKQLWNGASLSIEAVSIDTGGHFTHQVYNFVRAREHRRFYGVRGSNKYGGPIKGSASRPDVNWRGQVIKQGVKLWEVGTDTAKDLIYGRIKVVQPGPGCLHFAEDLPREWFEQFTAEVRVLQKTAAGEQSRWVKRRARNERLDTCVYAMHAAHMLDLHRYTEKMWDKLEAAVQPPPDLFGQPVLESEATEPAAPREAVHTDAQAPAYHSAAPQPNGFGRAW